MNETESDDDALAEMCIRDRKMTVRLHTGEPSIYGAVREQMDELDELLFCRLYTS